MKSHIFTVCAALLILACSGLPKPNKIHFLIRKKPGQLITSPATIEYDDGSGVRTLKTNKFGYFTITTESLKNNKTLKDLKVKATHDGLSAEIYTNEFSGFYDVYLENIAFTDSTADMHYHLSLKSYNAFANDLYNHQDKAVPTNYNWLRTDSKLKILTGTGWKEFDIDLLSNKQAESKELQTFLRRKWIRACPGANNLLHATEATFPHAVEGNVKLAFNAISPFEHSLANEKIKRWVSSGIKTGANIRWLEIMGLKDHISHWKNFNMEYNMVISQDPAFNNFHWSNLNRKDDLKSKLKKGGVVVNVVEGAHIFQDSYFPDDINYDLLDTTSQKKKQLYDDILGTSDRLKHASERDAFINRQFSKHKRASNTRKDFLIDSVLMGEILMNVDTFKKMNVHMISISHLSYNGMAGHAPALDVSKKPPLENFTSYLAKRAFGIRVSNDRQYKKSWDGLFFRVPGVNKFGDSVIHRLLSGDRYIHVDIKHADVLTRRFVLDVYERESPRYPNGLHPICSHCAVTGLSIDYTSPLLNEYSLLKSSLARKFYPFAINLYNEEIERICGQEGIIGIPLEERVLGGYIDNKQEWYYKISRKNHRYVLSQNNQPERCRRLKYTKKILQYMSQASTNSQEFKNVKNYYFTTLQRDSLFINEAAALEVIYEDYLSAEPFLQNIFHIVDIARITRENKKKDSLQNIATERTEKELRPGIAKNDPRIKKAIAKEVTKQMQALDIETGDSINANRASVTLQAMTSATDTALLKQARYNTFRLKRDSVVKKLADSSRMTNTDSEEAKIRRDAWTNICLGSDLDGMIDPIDICPTASQYPVFKEKLKVLIPLFIAIRQKFEIKDKLLPKPYGDNAYYFHGNEFTVDHALNMLFYTNLRDFTLKNFML